MPLPVLNLIVLLLASAAPAAAQQVAPPWLGRCLAHLSPPALENGALLPTDSPNASDYGSCAARCAGRCFLTGDFDGDGRPREIAVATPTELLIFHEVERDRGRARRYRATPAVRLALGGDEVALMSIRRTVRFADEVGLLRDGRSPLPALGTSEHLAFGLIVWRGAPATEPREEGDDDLTHSGEVGDLLVTIFDEVARTYRTQRVLQLGAP